MSYRSLVTLGVASIQGLPVASFNKDDAERLLFFCTRQQKENCPKDLVFSGHPSWLMPPAPSRKRSDPCSRIKPITNGLGVEDIGSDKRKLNFAAMRPIPHSHRQKILPFSGLSEGERYDGDQHGKSNQLLVPIKHNVLGPNSVTNRKSLSNSFQAHQIISLNPLPMKKHGCDRAPIRACSEVVFTCFLLTFATFIIIMPCVTLTQCHYIIDAFYI